MPSYPERNSKVNEWAVLYVAVATMLAVELGWAVHMWLR
jgi:hypothetical protein